MSKKVKVNADKVKVKIEKVKNNYRTPANSRLFSNRHCLTKKVKENTEKVKVKR